MNLVSRIPAAGGAHATRRLAVLALSLFCSTTAVAAGSSLGVDEVIQQALADSPQIASAQATLEGAQDRAPSANRLPDPEAILGVDNLPVNTVDRFSLTRDFMTSTKVGLMQTVPNGAKRRLRGELAGREVAVAEAQLHASRFETARAAADAWIACAATAQGLERLRGLREELRVQSGTARAALASGRSSGADALTSEAALARLDSRILELEQQLAMRRAELARWIGAGAQRDLGELPWQRELGSAPQALVQDVAAHPPLASIAAGLAVARTEVSLARAEKRPDWSAELSFAKRGPDYSDMVSLEFRIGLPLFAKHRQNPAIAAKLANVRAQEASQEAEIRMHRAEIEAMLAMWQSGRARLRHFETELLPLARDRSRAVLSSYGAARGDIRSVLESLSDEVDLQLEYVELEADVTRAWAFLHLLHTTGASS
jgi:cobalt-zinc-cadmium efflux system outer membrane protein